MHIAIVHGYYLEGTGSNLYVQNLCRQFCHLGHRVSLFCQEGERDKFDFINCAVDFSSDNQNMKILFERESDYRGKCTSYRPNLGRLLPVYVFDYYKGYEVKEFTHLSVAEIEYYITANQEAIKTCFRQSCPDLILSNHLIMQPVYVSRSCDHLAETVHFLTVHGSCLNFSVRKSPLLQEYALEGAKAADRLIFVGNSSQQDFLEFFHHETGLREKATVIPAGVDLGKFSPLSEGEEKRDRINNLVTLLDRKSTVKGGSKEEERAFLYKLVKEVKTAAGLLPVLDSFTEKEENRYPDQDTAEKLSRINWHEHNVVLYYGKYLWTKGAHLLIAAVPIVLREYPHTHFIFTGFGSSRGSLEALVAALDHGRTDIFHELINRPHLYFKGADSAIANYCKGLMHKLANHSFARDYFGAASGSVAEKIIFTGYLGHNELKDLIPCADITVAPSIFPESFGMVAVEALASGVIPLQTNHSGFSEVIREYSEKFSELFESLDLQPLLLDERLALNLANNIKSFLRYFKPKTPQQRQQIRNMAHQLAQEKYAWESVALRYLGLYNQIKA